MPSYYTEPVGKGELDDFSQFALKCSRAMGVAIMQRDEDGNAPLRIERKPDTHYRDTAEKYAAEVRRLEAASDDELQAEQLDQVAEENAHRADHLRRTGETVARYEAMLDKVNEWEPPTAEHANFKKFMRDQLVESIKFDGPISNYRQPAVMKPVEEYRAEQLATARRMRDTYEQNWREEQERVESRAKWIEDFLGSLPDPQAHAKAVAAYEAESKAARENVGDKGYF